MNPNRITLNPEDVASIAVGVCRTAQGNIHTGVVYSSDGERRFFHQAWHFDTRDGPLGDEKANLGGPFFCVVPDIDEERGQTIATFWRFIAELGEQIGYALRYDPRALFDESTGRLTLPNGKGLSCSTFVLALFRSVRVPLIDTAGWPTDRPGDREFQQRLLQILERTCSDLDHIEAVKQEIGCARVRPEEVAGAAMFSTLPVRHPEAQDAGLFIRGGLHLLGEATNV